MDKQKSLDQWRQFFAAMADGLLPYLQLYVKRNQRGSGVGNFVSSRYRYQVPLLMNNSSQIGSGGLQSARVHMVNPTQQTVEQAKSIVKQGNDSNSLKDLIEKAPVKRKRSTRKSQNGAKRRRSKTKQQKFGQQNKKAIKKRKKSYSYRDIFD